MILVVMGVSGSGKSTIGKAVADRLGWEFRDGDAFHPASNVAKMKAGTPLTDDDRRPWLLAIQTAMKDAMARRESLVIACSALKQAHRELLLFGNPEVQFAHLSGSKELIAERLTARRGHFMPSTLLDSQFATLEAPTDIPGFDIALPPGRIAEEIISRLGLLAAPTA